MRTKLTRFLTITVLALMLGSATAAPAAAQSMTPRLNGGPVIVINSWQTTSVDTVAQTVTVTTMTFYSDGTWSRTVETWSYNN